MDEPAPRIFLRPIGSPVTIGMSGLAVASLVQSGLDLKWVPDKETLFVGLILVSVPFALQTLACVFSYLARDGAAGAAVGLLAATWLALGMVHIVSRHVQANSALGLLLLAAGGSLALSALAVAVAKPLAGVVFAGAGLRFLLTGIYELSGVGAWKPAGGIVGLVVTALAAYCVLAFELEGQMRRPVLPTFRRARGAAAIAGEPIAQLDGIAHEAGVRQTT